MAQHALDLPMAALVARPGDERHPIIAQALEKPLRRRWLSLPVTPAAAASAPQAQLSFTIASYNMLAQSLVRRELFSYCSNKALKTNFRRENLLAELAHMRADLLCLQEVDRGTFDDYWVPKLGQLGYRPEWGSRTVNGRHGCAIFYQKDKFELFASSVIQFSEVLAEPYVDHPDTRSTDQAVRKASVFEEMNRPNVAMIVGLRVKEKKTEAAASSSAAPDLGLFVTTTHLFWDPRYRFVRLKQCQTLLDQVALLQSEHGTRYPTILTGDWNVTPCNIIHHYLTARNELEQNERLWTMFLTPAEHGMMRGGDEASAPIPESSPTPATATELAANGGVSDAQLAQMMKGVELGTKAAADAEAARKAFEAASASPIPGTSMELPWTPVSSAPIHQLRTQLIVGADGTVKQHDLERATNHGSSASLLRLSEVKETLHHSKQLPLLRSVYADYTNLAPDDVRASLADSLKAPYCKWTGEPPYTNYTEKFKGTLDYIFVPCVNPASDPAEHEANATSEASSHVWADILARPACTLHATHILEIPHEQAINHQVALPNDTMSSDHISIAARFFLATPNAAATTSSAIAAPKPQVSAETVALARSIAASLSPAPISPVQPTIPAASSASSSSSSSSSAVAPFSPFSVPLFQSLLKTKLLGRALHYSPTVTSTMDLCKDALFGGSSDSRVSRPTSGALWLADEQTKGRGRIEGRSWSSVRNANLYLTLLMQLNDRPWEVQRQELTKLNQSVCLAVAKAIEQAMATALQTTVSGLPDQLRPRVKWPNDVWIHGRKCSGMLIDSEIMGNELSVVIGVGINVHEDMRLHPDSSLASSATSISQSLSEYVAGSPDRALVAPLTRESLLASFLSFFESFAALPPSEVLVAYQQYDMLAGRTVVVMPKKREDTASYYEATAIGYTPEGYLIVERNGRREELVAEEVTIRPTK